MDERIKLIDTRGNAPERYTWNGANASYRGSTATGSISSYDSVL